MMGDGILLFLALWPMTGALVRYLIGRRNKELRSLAADDMTIVEFGVLVFLLLQVIGSRTYDFAWEDFYGLGLVLELDGSRALYGLIAARMWMMIIILSKEYFAHYRNRNRYYLFLPVMLGATVGVFLSADLYTTFIFFEVMSFTSYMWAAHNGKAEFMRTAAIYLGMAVTGGLAMLMGLFLLYHAVGALNMDMLLDACRKAMDARSYDHQVYLQLFIADALILFGFGTKTGMLPLHIWLSKAHLMTPAPASALLSGILTKVDVFGIAVVSCNIFLHDTSWGGLILMLGVVTMLGGALLALFSVDLKRTLACSSMSQVGFILMGMGMQGILGKENALAVRGTLLHMVNHSLIKLALFVAAGVVFQNLHKLNSNDIRGFGREKSALCFCFLMGALGIAGIPLWNGYMSKILLHESIVEYTHVAAAAGGSVGLWKAVEWTFLLSGGVMVTYMLKLFIALFVGKNGDSQLQAKYDGMTRYMDGQSSFAPIGPAVALPMMGFLPGIVMDGIADLGQSFFHEMAPEHIVHYFSLTSLTGAVISIGIGLVLYFGVVRLWMMKDSTYVNRWPAWLDLENLIYRPAPFGLLPGICGFLCQVLDRYLLNGFVKVFLAISSAVCRCMDHLVDSIIVLARKTIHRQTTASKRRVVSDRIAYALGLLCDDCILIMNKTVRRKRPIEISTIPRLMELEERIVTTNRLIGSSMSFGLMLVRVGLCLTLGYLLYSYIV